MWACMYVYVHTYMHICATKWESNVSGSKFFSSEAFTCPDNRLPQDCLKIASRLSSIASLMWQLWIHNICMFARFIRLHPFMSVILLGSHTMCYIDRSAILRDEIYYRLKFVFNCLNCWCDVHMFAMFICSQCLYACDVHRFALLNGSQCSWVCDVHEPATFATF